ncbi:MAG: caspase family protein, partial [Alphaproteobacteria bacterium]
RNAILFICFLMFSIGVVRDASAKRVALVIANSNYEHAGKLSNPSNDAKALAESFRRLDFDTVTLKENLDYRNLRLALKDFANESAGAELALVYFAGHGIEVSGQNFLIPTDARLESATDVDFEGIPLTSVLSSVEGAKTLKMVILDACRNNPFRSRMVRRSSTRSIGRGLAKVEPDNNTLIAFAAKEGTVALDGDSGHSPYANALLQVIEEPGVEIGFMFRRVRDLVLKATGQRQEPFTYGSLGGTPIYLKTPQKTADTKKSSESEDRISNLRRELDELKRQFNQGKTSDSDVEKKSEAIVIAKAESKTRENASVKKTATKDKAPEQKGSSTQAEFSAPVDSTKKGNDGSQIVASAQPNPTKLEKDAGAATGGPQVVAPQCPPGFTLSGGQCIRMGAGPGPRPQPVPQPRAGGGAGDWYAIAGSFKTHGQALSRQQALGFGWSVMNTNQCPNFRNGYWIATAGPLSKQEAQAYSGGASHFGAFVKTCY